MVKAPGSHGRAPRIALASVGAAMPALFALWLASHHPLSPSLALAATLGAGLAAAWRPAWSLALVLACLPWLSLAPWTGWMLVEELDLLVLVVGAGAWLGLVLRRPARPAHAAPHDRLAWLVMLLGLAWALTVLVAVQRGLADAGAWPLRAEQLGWWQAWREPMNVPRVAKGLLLGLAAWPLWRALQAADPRGAGDRLMRGAQVSLALVAGLATWERWAWTGLTNFSTDYRTTALFWETHVGGATLDGFLALTWPVALLALVRARNGKAWLLALALTVVVAYAALTTFSRGLYLGLVVASLVFAWLSWRQASAGPAGHPAAAEGLVPGGAASGAGPLLATLGWTALFALGAWPLFLVGGYRALLAWWGAHLLLLFGLGLTGRGEQPDARAPDPWVRHTAIGLAAGVLAALVALAAPAAWKLPYALFGAAALAAAGLLVRAWSDSARPVRGRAWSQAWWSLTLASALLAAAVAWHWAPEGTARGWVLPPLLLLVGVAAGLRGRASAGGPPGWRWRALAGTAMLLTGLIVAALGGGAYLGQRLGSVAEDWEGRRLHWSRAASLPRSHGEDWLGMGWGRFPARFSAQGAPDEAVGDLGWRPGSNGGAGDGAADAGRVVLTGGRHVLGFGELLRLSQRIGALSEGEAQVRWRARVDARTVLHVEVCRKHLLYEQGCRTAQVALDPAAGWQEGSLALKGKALPSPAVLAVAVGSRGGRIELDELSLVDAGGRERLHNGGFEAGLARWLPGSDRHHLPWHAKNMGLHLKLEQGWLGTALLGTLLLLAVARLTWGGARAHPLAPALAAGLAGFLTVGLFDSLIDVPRLALLFTLWLGVALTLRPPPPSAPPPDP